MKNRIINVQNVPISISKQELDNYICITDIAKAKTGESRSADVVKNWLRNRNTLEFLGTWEMIYNPDFKVVEFDHFKSEAGLHTFVLSVAEWINKTNAIGLYVKRGKYGGTYAHKDIAFEFASAISPVFKLYLIKEFQRLKENKSRPIEWNAKRFLTKNNYLIQTDAVKNYLLPQKDYKENLQWLAYAEVTGFSPVAPTSAPALSIADVAIELVPIAVISTSLQLFFIAVTSCLPIPPPFPSITRIFIKITLSKIYINLELTVNSKHFIYLY